MSRLLFLALIVWSVGGWAQSSSGSQSGSASAGSASTGSASTGSASTGSSSTGSASNGSQSGSSASGSSAGGSSVPASRTANFPPIDNTFPGDKPGKTQAPDFHAPRSDRVNVSDLGPDLGESSSKDTQVDTDAPENDARAHPHSADAVAEETAAGGSVNSIGEFHPWNPHKAAKSVEVGDYYFKRKNYKAAEDRYREALFYKENDAEATFHLAECLQKMERPGEALEQYQTYLKILPYGPRAEAVHEAVESLKAASKTNPAK